MTNSLPWSDLPAFVLAAIFFVWLFTVWVDTHNKVGQILGHLEKTGGDKEKSEG